MKKDTTIKLDGTGKLNFTTKEKCFFKIYSQMKFDDAISSRDVEIISSLMDALILDV